MSAYRKRTSNGTSYSNIYYLRNTLDRRRSVGMKTKEIKFGINGIFPTPVYQSFTIKKITEAESDFVEEQKSKVRKNEGNTATLDTYVLEQPVFKDLKNILEQHLEVYLKNVICPLEENIKIYITQSWLNYTTFHQHHHIHSHSNSFLSGVFYFKADKKLDKISFSALKVPPRSSFLELVSKDSNIFNAMECDFATDKAMLIIFPSALFHHVKVKKDDNERISLSFNTFVRGDIGHSKLLTQLKL